MNTATRNSFSSPMPKQGSNSLNSKQPLLDNWKDTGIVVLVILVMIIIILVLFYIIRVFKTSALKRVDLLNKIVALDSRSNLPYIVPSGKMAVVSRGQEFSYSFWIYLSENYRATEQHKLLFMRGNTSTNNSFERVDGSVNPIVMLDGKSNTLYFALSTTATPSSEFFDLNCIAKSAGVSCTSAGNPSNHLVTKVEYVPLQRWVHFSYVIRDNTATVFMDGDIYSIQTTNDIKVAATAPRPIIRGNAGDLIVGSPNFPVNGFMGKLEFYNFAMSHKQVQDVYKAGPVNQSMLAKFGLGNYGLRTPVYNLENAS